MPSAQVWHLGHLILLGLITLLSLLGWTIGAGFDNTNCTSSSSCAFRNCNERRLMRIDTVDAGQITSSGRQKVWRWLRTC